MSDNLTTLIGKVQGLLGDAAATYFTTAICTAAIRAALSEINERAPNTEILAIIASESIKEYNITDEDPLVMSVASVWLDSTTDQDFAPVKFDTFKQGGDVFVRLRDYYAADTDLFCIANIPHTVNGLDSETTSTLPAYHDPILVQGAAYHALLILGVSRGLANNLEKSATERYMKAAAPYRVNFDNGLKAMAEASSFKSEPDTFAWNDKYAENRSLYG